MHRRREHQEDIGPAPLPPLRRLALGRGYAPWASEDDVAMDGDRHGAVLPVVRRGLVTREAKLSLTDTITLLRARGPQQRQYVDAPEDDESTTDTPRTQGSRRTMGEFEPSGRHEQAIDGPIRQLTMADTITLPKPRVRRPIMTRPIPRAPGLGHNEDEACAAGENTSEEMTRDQIPASSNCGGPGCCEGPEYAVASSVRPSHRTWTAENDEEEAFDPSLGNLRRQRSVEEAQILLAGVSVASLSNTQRPASAPSSGGSGRAISSASPRHLGPERAVQGLGRGHTDEQKSVPLSSGAQQASDVGLSLAETLTLPKPRARRPSVGRDSQRLSPSSSKGKSGNDAGDDDDDDDNRPCCLGPEYEIREGMTPEEIRNVKKARRKEQCRVNQANYRRRKREVEMQTDREIQELHNEIEHLEMTRDNARKRARLAQDADFVLQDPMTLVQHTFLRLSPAQVVDRRLMRAPTRQVDAIVGLEYEEFSSVDELLAQWKYHHSVFETFELRLRSVRSEQIGDSLVLSAEATLRCTMVARSHKRYRAYGSGDAVVTCPVVQRFVFEERDRVLAKVISEVDWLAGLRDHSASPLVLAAELAASSSPSQATIPAALGTGGP